MTSEELGIPAGEVLPIVKDEAYLKQITQEFDFSSPPIDPMKISADLTASMAAHGGVGLAANQIGVPYRVFALRTSPEVTVCFNPKIVHTSDEQELLEEGCLSFPELIVKVKRPKLIRARFTYPSGETVTETYTGITARAFQHEHDHLNGIIFYTRASRFHRDQGFKHRDQRIRHRREWEKKYGLLTTSVNGITKFIPDKNKEAA